MHPRLQKEWERLEVLRQAYEQTLMQASVAQQEFKPATGGWSMLQVIRHLLTAEELSTDYLVKKNYTNAYKKGGLGTRLRSGLLSLMLRSPLKFKAPRILAAMEPQEGLKVEPLLAEWKNSREKLRAYLEGFPEEKLAFEIYRHPRSGWLTIVQTLQFFEDHLRHHQQQLARLQKDPHFPA